MGSGVTVPEGTVTPVTSLGDYRGALRAGEVLRHLLAGYGWCLGVGVRLCDGAPVLEVLVTQVHAEVRVCVPLTVNQVATRVLAREGSRR